MNKLYEDAQVVAAIREKLKQNPIVLLDAVLEKSSVQKIGNALPKGKKVCIPDRFSYEEIDSEKVPVSELRDFFEKVFLSAITSVDIRRFTHRDFTVLHDRNDEDHDAELILFLGGVWQEEFGGKYTVIVNDEKFEIVPKNNTALLVRRRGVQSYVSYVNALSGKKSFVMIRIKKKKS